MKTLFGGLRFKLIVGFVVVVLLAVGTVSLLTTRSTRAQFGDFIDRWNQDRRERLGRLVSTYYLRTGGWVGIQEVIGKVTSPGGERLVVVNGAGVVVADSENSLVGNRMSDLSWSNVVVNLPGRRGSLGKLLIKPGKSPFEVMFLSSINRSALVSAIIAGLVAITLAVIYSQRIASPVRSLTEAARQMEKGELGPQVEVRSGGEIGQLASAFNSMSARLEEQEKLRKNMVSDVAHELRTPLATIKGYLQITRDGLIEPDNRILESLHQEADLLSRLVDDLQDLSLADAGELKIEGKEIALEDVINQVVDTFARGKAKAKNIELKTDIQETSLVEADPQRIDQVVRNLLDNAISYTPDGGIVRISLEEGDRCVRVTVEDDGIGIPVGEEDRVFDRFYRVDKSRARKTGGSGLGLTVASRIVRAHGGEIGLETREGKGSRFWFTLPR